MLTVRHVLWGAPLPRGTRAHRIVSPWPDTPLAWTYVVASVDVFAITPEAVVVPLPVPPPLGLADVDMVRIVRARLAECAARLQWPADAIEMVAVRLYRDLTWVDVGAAVAHNSAHRRVLQTEVNGALSGRGAQCVAMTLRARDAAGDADGAVVPREVHAGLAQILVAVAGAARVTVVLDELDRRLPLVAPGAPGATAATLAWRIPPGITHTIYMDPGQPADAELHLLSIYTSAEHPWDRVQHVRNE